MTARIRVCRRAAAYAAAAALTLSGCIAADVSVVGRSGLTVDAQGQPVIVVEPCGKAPVVAVRASATRENLPPASTNAELGSWRAATPSSAQVRLPLTAPGQEWRGEPLTVAPGQGYIVSAESEGEVDGAPAVIGQVAFTAEQLAGLRGDRICVNSDDPDVRELTSMTPEEFRAAACDSRGP